MKYIIILGSYYLAFLGLTFACFGQNVTAVNITYPIDGMVLQRGSDNKATFIVAGQSSYGYQFGYDFYLRINKVSSLNGETNLGQVRYEKITTMSSTTDVKIFSKQVDNLEAGWYKITIEVWLEGGGPNGRRVPELFGSVSSKFGIGDNYIIGGQSNAQGFPTFCSINVSRRHGGDVDGIGL